MSHKSGRSKNDDKEGSGPRPPVPGKECCVGKMTENQNAESSKSSQPSYLNWARNFDFLLEDPDGVQLFKEYVEDDSPFYNDHLTFYFACEGLKLENDLEKVKRLIKAIYSNFLKRKDSPLIISDNLRRTIRETIKNEIPPSCHIFDELQKEVEFTIRTEVYPNFPTSMKYIDYIQRMTNPPPQEKLSSSSSSSSSLPPLLTYSEQKTTTPIQFSGSACGSAYGPSTSASSSGSISATDTLPRSSTLPTLHEESELSLCNEVERDLHFGGESAGAESSTSRKTAPEVPVRLTRDVLLLTQNKRLEIRPPGAHGYLNGPRPYSTHSSYMPNSRVDSERGSISSGGRTDSEYSDTLSLSNCNIDGRPYSQRRKGSSAESKIHINKAADIEHMIPRTQRHINPSPSNDLKEFHKLLLPKLNEIKRKQDMEEKINLFNPVEDDDQDILDQHVSRVFKDQTPTHRSPGTLSPYPPPLPSRKRHDSGILSDATGSIGGYSMKHSKSMPENSSSSARKLTNKWASITTTTTDSGISIYSDTLMKYKDNRNTKAGTGAMVSFQLEEAKRKLEEDNLRRSRRYSQQHPPPPGVFMPPQSISSSSSGSSSLHHLAGQAPPLPAKPQETTTVVFSFCDEDVPYRTRIPGTSPTLRQFKDYLPKKGNFRFFFKTFCDDPDNPVIQEEISNDSDPLPFFEGKVMGFVKPCDF